MNMKTEIEILLEELKENGRQLFDTMQKNLSAVATSTDEELQAQPDPFAEMFGEIKDAETRREDARNTQDSLDRLGRESYATEYALSQIKNLIA
jgi:hypothetical protein